MDVNVRAIRTKPTGSRLIGFSRFCRCSPMVYRRAEMTWVASGILCGRMAGEVSVIF